jgi:TRAP-type C4-dicarboxylate transport system permease small subunit
VRHGLFLRALETAACLALGAMMLLTVADVLGRHALGRPVPGTVELVQYALAIVVFAGLPVVTRDGRHISLSLLEGRLGAPARRLQRLVLGLASAVILAAQGWIVFGTAQLMRAQGDVIGFLNLPVHPAAYLMSILSFVTAAALLLDSTLANGREAPSGGAAH